MTNYALDGLEALLEKDGTGATQVRYVTGLARIASGSVVYYLEDRLGSVAGLVDANQNVTDTFRYDAWGNLLQQQGTTNPAYQWVGEEDYYLNPDAGLYLMGLRHYAPGLGRFLTRDPLGLRGRNPNPYCYVGNNPINLTDPSGMITAEECYEKYDITCGNKCRRMRSKVRRAICWAACAEEYAACLATVAAGAVCSAVGSAAQWLADHAGAVVGTIVVIGGITYIVATGGAGALVLLPAAAL